MATTIKVAFAILALAALPTLARADWNEATNGEFSDNRLAPTLVPLALGSNIITASTNSTNLDYFRIVVPAGQRLSAIMLNSFTSASTFSFLGVQAGTQFSVTPLTATPGSMLGYTHFGAAPAAVGTDILDNMATGSGAIGFTPPLQAGNYVFWANETAASNSDYSFNFVVTAAPAVPALPAPWLPALTAVLLAAAGAVALRLRRRS